MSMPPVSGIPTCYRHPDRPANIRCQRCGRPICTADMVPAAVGFQCPSCVAEGNKSTRSGLNPYGGRVAANPALTTFTLIGINVAVWIAVLGTGWHSSNLINRLGLLPRGVCQVGGDSNLIYPTITQQAGCERRGLEWIPGTADGAYWQLITSAFMHVEIWHIGSNMLALFVLGPTVERVLGRARFLALYLVSALAGSMLVLFFSTPYGVSLGASGAIFGLLGALVVIIRKTGGDLSQVAGVIVINLVITFTVPHISWEAHVGGFIGGFAVTYLLVHAPRGARRTQVQWLGVGGITALLLLGVVVRAAMLTG